MLAAIRFAVVTAIAITITCPAYGQHRGSHQTASQVPHYAPQSPTTSPYLSLLNRNGSAATNYYGLVRPLQQQQSVNETQAQQTTSQEQQIGHIRDQQQDFEQPQVKPTGTAGWFQNLGKTPPYQVASHFYGQWPAAKSKRRGTSGR